MLVDFYIPFASLSPAGMLPAQNVRWSACRWTLKSGAQSLADWRIFQDFFSLDRGAGGMLLFVGCFFFCARKITFPRSLQRPLRNGCFMPRAPRRKRCRSNRCSFDGVRCAPCGRCGGGDILGGSLVRVLLLKWALSLERWNVGPNLPGFGFTISLAASR